MKMNPNIHGYVQLKCNGKNLKQYQLSHRTCIQLIVKAKLGTRQLEIPKSETTKTCSKGLE